MVLQFRSFDKIVATGNLFSTKHNLLGSMFANINSHNSMIIILNKTFVIKPGLGNIKKSHNLIKVGLYDEFVSSF